MNKELFLYSLVFSSYICGMDHNPLELYSYKDKLDPSTPCYVIFKPVSDKLMGPLSCVTLTNPLQTPHHYRVHFPSNSYFSFSYDRLLKKETIKVLKKLFKSNATNDQIHYLLMTIKSAKELSGSREYSFLMETRELPQPIKDACNITTSSRAEERSMRILLPIWCLACLLCYYF
jgi:hypothetical protein